MLQRTNDLNQVVNGAGYIDGYISTDVGEFEYYLKTMLGFHSPSNAFQVERNSLGEYLVFTLVKHGGKIPVQTLDLDVPTREQAAKFRREIGFIPMASFRLHSTDRTASRELGGMVKVLLEQRQNVAVLNHHGTVAYVAISEFYV